MLDLEYEECLKATKSRNIEDYDQGPTGDDWDKEIVTDPEVAQARGYEAFASVHHQERNTEDEREATGRVLTFYSLFVSGVQWCRRRWLG